MIHIPLNRDPLSVYNWYEASREQRPRWIIPFERSRRSRNIKSASTRASGGRGSDVQIMGITMIWGTFVSMEVYSNGAWFLAS